MSTKIDISKIADELLGTSKTIDEVLEDYNIDFYSMSIEQCEELDSITVQCDICGWWHNPDELNEDQCCLDCHGG